MSLEFYKTLAGRKFYEGTLPRIATALERIADCLDKEQSEPEQKSPTDLALHSILTDATTVAENITKEVNAYNENYERAAKDH